MSNRLVLGLLIGVSLWHGQSAHADPIVATAYLTIGADQFFGNQTWSGTATIANPANPQLPIGLEILGPPIPQIAISESSAHPGGLGYVFTTSYDLKIYFGLTTTPNTGSQQSNPYVDITGNLSGNVVQSPAGSVSSGFKLTSMSIALENARSAASTPASLLSLFSNPNNYTSAVPLAVDAAIVTGRRAELALQINANAPEPAAWAVFTLAIAGLALRCSASRRASADAGASSLNRVPG